MSIPEPLEFYARKLGYPHSERLGKIFSIIFDTPEKQQIATLLPATSDRLVLETGMSLEAVEKNLAELRAFGAILRDHKTSRKVIFDLYPGIIELRDAVLLTPGIDLEMVEMWDHLIRKELPKTLPAWIKRKIPPVMRTIPVERTVDARSTVLDMESARSIVENAKQVVVIPCVCRSSRHSLNKSPDCPAPEDAHICMLINRFGQESLERGIGKQITGAEAVEKLKAAEEAGLVHMTRNNVKDDLALCNCCSCCCTGLFLVNQIKYDAFAPSRFQVSLDAEACVGCGTCVDRCQFEAIEVDDIAQIDLDSCFGCGNCVLTCPSDALVLEEVRPREFIRST